MDLGLKGKVAIVTGPAKGMGAAITLALAREGVDLCLAGRDMAAVAPVTRDVLGLGRNARKEFFAGLANYRVALGDHDLWTGALRVLGYGAILVPVMLGLALLFALLLDLRKQRTGWRR